MGRSSFGFVLMSSMLMLSLLIENSLARNKRKAYDPIFPTGCDHEFGICNKTFNYPKKTIANYLKRHPILNDSVNIRTSDHITSRQFDAEDGINMCDTVQAFSIPEAMPGEDGKMMFIVNNVGNFRQSIEYDKCSTSKKCMFSSHFPNDYETSCKQHKITLKLLSMDSNKIIKFRPFGIPGGCACVYKLQRKRK